MPEYDPQEAHLVKQLDARIIPILVLTYLVALINRTNIDYARVNLEKNMGIQDWEFIVCLAGIFIGTMTFSCGFLACCMAGAQTWKGLFIVRILFGAAQAGFVPGILLYLASFYTRDERTVRLSFVVGVATCASTFGAVFAKSLERLDGVGGTAGWKWLFIMEGLPAIVLAFVIFFLLPSFPQTTLFISPSDRLLAASRVSEEFSSEPETPGARRPAANIARATLATPPTYHFQLAQLQETFTDPQFYLLAAAYFCLTISTDALAQLAPEIAAGTFTRGQGATRFSLAAAVLSVAPYGVAAGCSILWAYRSDRVGDRGLHVALPLVVAGIGFAVIAVIPESRWREVKLEEVEDAIEHIILASGKVLVTVAEGGVVKTIANLTAGAVAAAAAATATAGVVVSPGASNNNASGITPSPMIGNLTHPTTIFSKAPAIPSPTPSPTTPSSIHFLNLTFANGTLHHLENFSTTLIPLPQLDAEELNIVAEQADLLKGGDGNVAAGALRYFFGLVPASIGLLSALPSLLAFVIDRTNGLTAREAAAALVTAMGSVGGGVAVPLLFPPSQAPDEDAEGVATWGRGYAFGCGLCALGCLMGSGFALIVRWIKLKEDQGVWGRGRGLRRLLNDAEEKGAWEDGDGDDSFGDAIHDEALVGNWRAKAMVESMDNVGGFDDDWGHRGGGSGGGGGKGGYKNLF
ncbi:hypothetical protein HDU97_000257 [Phlyctochytrium planicorne]|nr:hypothetical protein HDU97_000257 [Phlyctochytrium planicorne]